MSDIIAAKATNRWWEKKKEPLSVWQACRDAEGVEYFYNAETKETTWEKPKELMTADELDSQVWCSVCSALPHLLSPCRSGFFFLCSSFSTYFQKYNRQQSNNY